MQEKVSKGGSPNYKIIGTRPVRPDGVDKVTGRARFGADDDRRRVIVLHEPSAREFVVARKKAVPFR